ncbi:Adenine phosphoribosyltransferase [Treponema brennaborense DSM 12168]|uniref:Adenine phosphoribosyltransferase n=2 Tax=Treponema TaxID=157 RepID=F4LIV1_TREBD|nr:Adenine phosphoribosyltransferase [Treponema brennaborense DSM 12168]
MLDKAIRRIPDFPKPGILFYDITGVLVQPDAFTYCIDRLAERCKAAGADAIAGIESRGFLFAAPLADRLKLPLILIRKKGKLPGKTYSCKYSLEYGTAEIEAHVDDIKPGQKIIVIDDLIATGGTLKAARTLIEQGGATVASFLGVVGLPFLHYRQVLDPTPVLTLIDYDAE